MSSIAFCTSFRARALANDWPYHTWLLERVVHSMLSQTRGEAQVVVGCHDIPIRRYETIRACTSCPSTPRFPIEISMTWSPTRS